MAYLFDPAMSYLDHVAHVFVPRFPGDKYIDQSGPATMWESKDGSTWVQTNP